MTAYMSAEVGRRIDEAVEALVRRRMRMPTQRVLQTDRHPTTTDLAGTLDRDRQAAFDTELNFGRNAAVLDLDTRPDVAGHGDRKIVLPSSSEVGPDGKRRRGRKPKAAMVKADQARHMESTTVTAPARSAIRLVRPDASAAAQPAAQITSPPPSLAECLSILPRIRGRQSRLHA